MTRATAKAMTRERLIGEARRLFRERGYAATSLEQIAEAADVTKGAIYGHFASKEDLLLSAIEAAPTPDYGAVLNDQSRPLRERLRESGRAQALSQSATDKAELAVSLEFIAALLRSPGALRRYGTELGQRLGELAAADKDQPVPGTSPLEVWAIGAALVCGLQIYQQITPDIITPDVFERACELLAGLYPDEQT
jgi:AcrR family transcriptional regulator